MLFVLKGEHPIEGEMVQEFTRNESETAVAISDIWENRGWQPRLFIRVADHIRQLSRQGDNLWLNQRKAA